MPSKNKLIETKEKSLVDFKTFDTLILFLVFTNALTIKAEWLTVMFICLQASEAFGCKHISCCHECPGPGTKNQTKAKHRR